MKRILFVGEHPLSVSGNGGMMESILSSLDTTKYSPVCFALESIPVDPVLMVPKPFPFPVISSVELQDGMGSLKLLNVLRRGEFDAFVTVGIDLWHYYMILQDIKKVVSDKGIPWVSIFPYDLQMLRDDWVRWIKNIDFPCVYSQYGYELLKDEVPNVRYFRPQLQAHDLWKQFDKEKQMELRRHYFPSVGEDTFVFGFVGANQIRKDPQLAIQAYSIVKDQLPDKDIRMYLHTNVNAHFNLKQYARDCGLETNDLWTKKPNTQTALSKMVFLYNSLDCLVNCSLQEGLSWTLVEAMLCGLPFIASHTTSQIELLETAGYSIPCEEPTYMPLFGSEGHTWMDAKRCKVEDLVEAMYEIVLAEDLRKELTAKGLKAGKEWLEGVSDVNEVLEEACYPKVTTVSPVEEAVLFAQHSSAGDVLMTTQCFKGIKERHPNLPLIYMTSKIFMNIVEGNPYIDDIIPWNEKNLKRAYRVLYNPHGEKILPGRFNTLNTKLYDMYPYFCNVEPDEMYIHMEDTPESLIEQMTSLGDYVVVHTTGGAQSRIYVHMDKAVSKLKGYKTVQIGGKSDFACKGVDLDLRGRLTWRETAYVMWLAHAAVAIDSYPAHLAGAVHTPVVALFGPAPARVTGPRSDKAPVVCLEPNHLDVCPQMGFCYGDGSCPSPCINTINPMKIRTELTRLLKENDNSGKELQSKKEGVS